jgi:REP element-mobilizing transposase RayT
LNRVLQHFNDIRYRLHAWVAMPNHVHVLFSPSGMEPVARTIGAWKGVSARRIHQRLGGGQERLNTEGTVPQTRAGVPALPNRPIQSTGDSYRLWQPEYWDTLIRSAAHLAACRRYIANNPARASLANTEYTLWVEDGDH